MNEISYGITRFGEWEMGACYFASLIINGEMPDGEWRIYQNSGNPSKYVVSVIDTTKNGETFQYLDDTFRDLNDAFRKICLMHYHMYHFPWHILLTDYNPIELDVEIL